jgi:DNA sulfur modification protein DndB
MAKPAKTPAYAALLLQQNRRRFYFSTIPIDDLFPYCFVSKREEDPKEGFQRILDPARAEAIAKYLAAGSGSIPSNIVLSAQPEADFEYVRRTKTVSFQRTKRAFLVLDGQHRLWGYQQCRIRHRVPVAVYQDLSRADEAKLFIDINTNQRGVPAALLLDIKKLAQMESERESTLRDLFDRLKSDSRSPIAGKLSPSKSLSGRISRVTFNRAVGVALDSPIVSDMDSDERYRLVLNYLNAFDAELDSKKLLVRSAFFESMFEIFDEVVRATVTATGNAKQEALQETVRLIAKVNYTGTTSKKGIVSAMQTALRKTVQISGDML